MQILRTGVVAAMAALQSFSASTKLTRSELVLVKAVFDGDTINVTTYGRVRLLGIDAPETSHGLDTAAPFGNAARDKLSSMILSRWIRLESEGPTTDIYNRRLAYALTEDGQCINTVMVREGLARVSAREPLARLDELKRAEIEAQRFRRGIWANAPSVLTPGYTRDAKPAKKAKGAKASHPKKKKSP